MMICITREIGSCMQHCRFAACPYLPNYRLSGQGSGNPDSVCELFCNLFPRPDSVMMIAHSILMIHPWLQVDAQVAAAGTGAGRLAALCR